MLSRLTLLGPSLHFCLTSFQLYLKASGGPPHYQVPCLFTLPIESPSASGDLALLSSPLPFREIPTHCPTVVVVCGYHF